MSREREGPNGAQDVQKIQPPKTNSSVNGEAKLKPKASPQPQTRQLTPTITTTIPSPSVPQDSTHPPTSQIKPSRRASFHPPPMNTAFSREVLLTSRTGVLPGAAGLTVDEGKGTEDAILDNVEELLEGFEWTAGTGFGENGRKKGSADAIEGRLLDELTAMDSVS